MTLPLFVHVRSQVSSVTNVVDNCVTEYSLINTGLINDSIFNVESKLSRDFHTFSTIFSQSMN